MEKTSTGEYTLKELFLFVWVNKIILLISSLLCLIISIIYASSLPEIYSSSSFLITRTGSSSNSGQFANIAALAGINLGGQGNADPSDYLDKVIEDEDFVNSVLSHKWVNKKDSLLIESLWHIKRDTLKDNWELLYEKSKVGKIRKEKRMQISKDKRTSVLCLTTNFETSEIAYQVNRFVIDRLGIYIRTSLKTQAKEKRIFIEERIGEVKVELEKSENNLAAFKDKNFTSISPKLSLEETRLVRNVSINQEVYLQLQKQYELSKIEETNDQPLIEVIKSPEIPIRRSSPKRQQIVVIGFLIGGLLGISIALAAEWYRSNFGNSVA
jgi:capsule polysaccharide export protein KpsE/RkpR